MCVVKIFFKFQMILRVENYSRCCPLRFSSSLMVLLVPPIELTDKTSLSPVELMITLHMYIVYFLCLTTKQWFTQVPPPPWDRSSPYVVLSWPYGWTATLTLVGLATGGGIFRRGLAELSGFVYVMPQEMFYRCIFPLLSSYAFHLGLWILGGY